MQKKRLSLLMISKVLSIFELYFFSLAFDPSGMLRRTDSKESNCSSIHSIAHGREDLRQTLSVPVSAFHVS